MAKSKTIEILNDAGQSAWYDNLSRDVLQSGELAGLIAAGVSGLTSNPTIFKAAIADSANYDDDLRRLAGRGLDASAVCDELMFEDVRRAADLLRPVFDSTAGADGYASVEVSPLLAYDARRTVEDARRIWQAVARPNVMIKIPATREGVAAIGSVLEEGINVNVTLIFSVQRHREVIESYLTALERRVSAGRPIQALASVASFFVSRVDEIVEKRCVSAKAGAAGELAGKYATKVAIANSKLAYALFMEQFGTQRFAALKRHGARVQRPLWASTGTKNPDLPPLIYVNALAGKDTVNTLKPETLKALLSAETVAPALHQGLAEARELVAALGDDGINLEELLAELETAGVKAFADSYGSLLGSVDQKLRALA